MWRMVQNFSCAPVLLQNTLTEFMSTWDNHTVRMSNKHAPTGKPSVLYALPALYSCEDHLTALDTTDIVLCDDECAGLVGKTSGQFYPVLPWVIG